MDDESEQKHLLSKTHSSDDDVTVTTHADSFCGDFRDPSSRCYRMIVLVFMCFLSFGEFLFNNLMLEIRLSVSLWLKKLLCTVRHNFNQSPLLWKNVFKYGNFVLLSGNYIIICLWLSIWCSVFFSWIDLLSSSNCFYTTLRTLLCDNLSKEITLFVSAQGNSLFFYGEKPQ